MSKEMLEKLLDHIDFIWESAESVRVRLNYYSDEEYGRMDAEEDIEKHIKSELEKLALAIREGVSER